jgi:hypothetical protein
MNYFWHYFSRKPFHFAADVCMHNCILGFQICQYVFAVSMLVFKQSDVAKFFRETMQRVKELAHFGGFLDCEYLRRTLAKEFQLMESRYSFLAPSHCPHTL